LPIYLTLTAFGIFVLDKNANVIAEYVTYPDLDASASEVSTANEGKPTTGLRQAVNGLSESDTDEIVVESSSMARALSALTKIPVRVEQSSPTVKWFRMGMEKHLQDSGAIESDDGAAAFKRAVGLALAKSSVSTASEARDLLVKHAIDAIGETDKSINVAAMRLREWYSLHHSSLSKSIEDPEQFIRVVIACKGHDQVDEDLLRTVGLSDSLVQSVISNLDEDVGADFEEADLAIVSRLAESIRDLYELRKELEDYVGSMMRTLAPNMTALVGPMVGARLISLAGSMKDLASRPSSTVQVYGAERALFRSLKTGTDPPKHGIIYQVPEIYSAPYWQRGKIARALAGKLSIAAKIDAYSRKDVGEELRKAFEKRTEDIRKQNPEPPEKPPLEKKVSRPPRMRPSGQGHHKPDRRRGGRNR
jgi:nucleolar protein 56